MNALIKCCLLLFAVVCFHQTHADYLIGAGRSDVTGPAAEVTFMGYAKAGQKGCGIHLRQYARAFIISDKQKKLLFVSVDAGMVGIALKKRVVKLLKQKFGVLYNEHNFILSGTHTHSGPGGFLMDLLFDIPSFGFVKQSFYALAHGITKAIIKAHNSLAPGKIYTSSGTLLGANINRSPAAYLYNTEEERKKYSFDVDKEMVQLRFVSLKNNKPIGVINWFPVHPTSMNNTNCLVSSDNVGYASILMEAQINENKIPGQGSFVAAFASSNLGDVSPNIKGARCVNTGEECEMVTSTCNGEAKYCIASGPGKDMFESTEIIANRLYGKAMELWRANIGSSVSGPLNHIHQFVDMPSQKATFEYENGTKAEVRGCLPAMGYSFAAGTTDGPGEFDFTQGTTTSNPLWNLVRDFLAKPTKDDIACHHPKPILLLTGRVKFPYQWQPRVVSVQMFRIGNFYIAAVPGEFTTMSGRRLKEAVRNTLASHSADAHKNAQIVIAGLSNVYSDYIATPEEYQLQRYEAASTIFGPHTLTIYLKLYRRLTEALLKNKLLESGPEPHDFSNKLISLTPPVIFDITGWNQKFGDCISQPKQVVKRGENVVAKFVAGHPRNNLMQDKTFLTVERLSEDKEWEVVATDANWETRFIWKRPSKVTAKSSAEIHWKIGEDVKTGTYRIQHFGHYKYVFGGIKPYEGATRYFNVTN